MGITLPPSMVLAYSSPPPLGRQGGREEEVEEDDFVRTLDAAGEAMRTVAGDARNREEQ